MLRIGAVLALICLALFFGGRWLVVPHGQERRPAAAVATPDNSNYYLKQATVYQLAEDGSLAYRMTVAQLLHFADDSARLTDIDVHYLNNTQTYWNLHAPEGRIPAGRHEIYLSGGVVIHHPRASGEMVTVNAPHAWVRPRIHRVDSDARVVATEPGRRVTGNGMRINLQTNKLNLLRDVHVSYAP